MRGYWVVWTTDGSTHRKRLSALRLDNLLRQLWGLRKRNGTEFVVSVWDSRSDQLAGKPPEFEIPSDVEDEEEVS